MTLSLQPVRLPCPSYCLDLVRVGKTNVHSDQNNLSEASKSSLHLVSGLVPVLQLSGLNSCFSSFFYWSHEPGNLFPLKTGSTVWFCHDEGADFVLFLFSMYNVIVNFLFYGEKIKCSRGMRTGWRGTWYRTIMYSTLLGWKWQPCVLFGKFSCFRLTWFVMECKDQQYLVRFLFRKNIFQFFV